MSFPVDASLIMATGSRLWYYDEYCINPLVDCPGTEFTGLAIKHNILYAATSTSINRIPLAYSATCGTPILAPQTPAPMITSLFATDLSLFWVDRVGVWGASITSSFSTALTPKLLYSNTNDKFTGVRTGVAVYGNALYYTVSGTLNGQDLRGILQGTPNGGPEVSVFFRYAGKDRGDVGYWYPGQLTLASGSVLMWTELRAAPGRTPVYAIQRTDLSLPSGSRFVNVTTSFLAEANGGFTAQLAPGDAASAKVWASGGAWLQHSPPLPRARSPLRPCSSPPAVAVEAVLTTTSLPLCTPLRAPCVATPFSTRRGSPMWAFTRAAPPSPPPTPCAWRPWRWIGG